MCKKTVSEFDVLIEDVNDKKKFIDDFDFNLKLLSLRIKKLQELSPYDRDDNNQRDWFTFFDMIIVQLRAMFIENERYTDNYTFQNYLALIGKDHNIKPINDYLQSPFVDESILDEDGKPLSIRNAIKLVADKFICHYDNTTYEQKSRMETISSQLSNVQNESVQNIQVIIKNIINLTKE